MGGGSSDISQDKNITTNTHFKNALHKTTKLINDISVSMIQSQLTQIDNNAVIKQTIKISHIKSEGDITVSGIHETGTTKMNVSMLADSDMKESLVQDLTQNIQDKMKTLTSSTQDQLDKDGEQILGDIVGDVTNTAQAVAGDVTGSDNKVSRDTTIAENMGIDNETELNNKIKESVNTELVNQMVNNVSNALLGDQEIDISDLDSSKGEIAISDISTTILMDTLTTTVTESGLSNNVVSKFTGLSVTDVEDINKAEQALETKQEGTIDAAGKAGSEVIGAAGDAGSELVKAGGEAGFELELPWIIAIVAVVIGVVVVAAIMFRGGGRGEDKDDEDEDDESKKSVTTESVTTAEKQVGSGPKKMFKRFYIKNTDIINGILIITIFIFFCLIIKDIIRVFSIKTEPFDENSAKLMKFNNKFWLSKESLNEVKVSKFKKDALQVNKIIPRGSNKMMIQISGDLYLKYNKGENRFSFEPIGENIKLKAAFHFMYESDGTGYYLKIDDKYLHISPKNVLITSLKKAHITFIHK